MNINAATERVHSQAEALGYSIQECLSFDGCYFIVDLHTHLVIAGAQEFLDWNEVVRWVTEAGTPRTLQ